VVKFPGIPPDILRNRPLEEKAKRELSRRPFETQPWAKAIYAELDDSLARWDLCDW
jgi:hypothetical protein